MSSKLILAMQIAMNANVPTLLWGPPGVGKTSTIMQIAEVMDLPIEVVIASIREPADFSGLPVIPTDVTENGVFLSPPDWARRLAKAGKGILFFDEISTAPPATQAALLRVALDKCVGDLKLPNDVVIFAAANPPEIAAGGWDLAPPLANRFCHLDWSLHADEWCEGMIAGWNTMLGTIHHKKEIPKAFLAQKKAIIASFIRSRQSLLLQLPKDESATGKAWPSPRSWMMAATLLASCQTFGYNEESEVAMTLLSGCVGEGPALEFIQWKEQVDLPDPEAVLRDPSIIKFPSKRGDIIFAILSSITAAVLDNNTQDRWLSGWKILGNAADQGFADVGAICAKTLSKHRPKNYNMVPKEVKKFEKILRAVGLFGA